MCRAKRQRPRAPRRTSSHGIASDGCAQRYLEGVKNVFPKMIFDPPWSPEMMTEDAKFALGF